MKLIATSLILLSAAAAHAEISEQTDNLLSSHCGGRDFDFVSKGSVVSGWFTTQDSRTTKFSGELTSVTIDTGDSSVNILAHLKGLERVGIRYITVKDVPAGASAALHADLSHVAGELGSGVCDLNFK